VTKQEAYAKAKKIGGKVYVTETLGDHPDPTIGVYESFSVGIEGIFGHGDSWSDCFVQIAKQDIVAIKADKIAKLKAELEELES
jgi:hypothetical protein